MINERLIKPSMLILLISFLTFTLVFADSEIITDNSQFVNKINKSSEKVLIWNYSLEPTKIKDDAAYFDGIVDYSIIKDSEKISFINNSLKIEVEAKIDENSSGVLVSKFDYLNGKFFELAVNVEGTIRFDVGDENNSITLETNKNYNDGKYHIISISLNNINSSIYVDRLLEAESDTSLLSDINSNVSISIGANTGYIPWMNQTIDNFRGIIKDVKINYE